MTATVADARNVVFSIQLCIAALAAFLTRDLYCSRNRFLENEPRPMRRVILPAVDPAISKFLSVKHPRQRGNGRGPVRTRQAISDAEAHKWARFLIAQYGADAEELAEIGVIEMLAMKNGAYLVAWSKIYAAVREIRSHEGDRSAG
jgi:hypothetical protein